MASLAGSWQRNNSLVCVGLDPEPARFPATLQNDPDAIFTFCRDIVDATADLVCCFKPQIAYFAAHRAEDALERLIAHIHAAHPYVPVILDAKRGDIGSTASQYACEAFDRYGADAVTLSPYLGRDAVQPFLDRADKGVILLCHTSNPGAADVQDLLVNAVQSDSGVLAAAAAATSGDASLNHPIPLYQYLAAKIAREWNAHGNCALVVGATFSEQLGQVRTLVGAMPILVPGIGAQGGDVTAVVHHGATAAGSGLMISSSRAILYAGSDARFADAARVATSSLRDAINRARKV